MRPHKTKYRTSKVFGLTYKYPDLEGERNHFFSLMVRWDNLKYVCSWEFEYQLFDCVLGGAKPLANVCSSDKDEILELHKKSAENGLHSEWTEYMSNNRKMFSLYIYRPGNIKDLFNIDELFKTYEKFGIAYCGDNRIFISDETRALIIQKSEQDLILT